MFCFHWLNTQEWNSESYSSSIFNFLRKLHSLFYSVYTYIHSHQQCIRVPFSPHPFQHLFFFFFSVPNTLNLTTSWWSKYSQHFDFTSEKNNTERSSTFLETAQLKCSRSILKVGTQIIQETSPLWEEALPIPLSYSHCSQRTGPTLVICCLFDNSHFW